MTLNKKKCPLNYLALKTTDGQFCIAKYEMKKGQNGEAVSRPNQTPWMNITHDEAISACKKNGKGYDLVSNHLWTLVARDIADTKINWSTRIPYSGALNIGHADTEPDRALAASFNDNLSCFETNQNCSLAVWDLQRRTHTLSNGEIIWDFAGNAAEWIKDLNDKKQIEAPQGYISNIDPFDQRYSSFGPTKKCLTNNVENYYCGLGYYWTHDVHKNAMGRSGFWKHKSAFMAGIFSLGVDVRSYRRYEFMGFRCIYR